MERTTVQAQGLGFTVVIEPDLEEGGYIVHCPALKGCWSQGETVDEALANITDAIIGCLAVRLEKAMEEVRARVQIEQEPISQSMSIPVQVTYG